MCKGCSIGWCCAARLLPAAVAMPQRKSYRSDLQSIYTQNMLGIKTDTGVDELIGYSKVRNAFAVCGQETWRCGNEEFVRDGYTHSVAFGGRKTALRNGRSPVWRSPLASSLLPPRARPRGCEGPIRARGLQVCHHSGLANRPGTSRRLPDGATTARGPLKLAPDCHARPKSGARRTPLSSCSR